MTQPQPHNTPEIEALQQQWSALDGMGPRALELKGDDFTQTLARLVKEVANGKAQKFGLELGSLKPTSLEQQAQGR